MATTDEPAPRTRLPSATLVWVLLAGAMLWFAGRLTALRTSASHGLDQQTSAALLTFALPPIISAAAVLGAGAGLAAVLWRGAAGRSRTARAATGTAGGAVAAALAGAAIAVSGDDRAVLTAAAAVAVAALLGGLAGTVRPPVLAAGLAGAFVVAVVQFLSALYTSPLRSLLDGPGTGADVATAEIRLAMVTGVLAGLAAGAVAHSVLTRLGHRDLAGHLVAGGAAGALLLLSEVVTRATLPLLISAAGGHTGDDPLVLQLTAQARLNIGLLVFFTGAISALIGLGRGMSRKRGRPAATSSAASTGDEAGRLPGTG